MQPIETTARVMPDGTLTVSVPPTIEPGLHRVVVVIGEATESPEPVARGEEVNLRPVPLNGWPDDARFRREELYGDNGR
jgi:hypothetical protein